jgi:hypothetical protein
VIPLHGCEERHKKNTPNCVVRNTTNAKTDNHQLKRIWDMDNKTAVEWFIEQLEMINKIYHFESVEYFKARQKVFEKAIKMYNETYGGGEQ